MNIQFFSILEWMIWNYPPIFLESPSLGSSPHFPAEPRSVSAACFAQSPVAWVAEGHDSQALEMTPGESQKAWNINM